ncbi:hypothetical protein ACWGH2_29360 [Streptomyces sp. NPDC054871]
MTLAELITALEAADPSRVVPHGFNNPHSYRGYYDELAFEPARDITVREMLDAARSALYTTFQGYKGGDYVMHGHTDVWLSEHGTASGDTLSAPLLEFMLAATVQQPADGDLRDRIADGQGEPAELRNLPREVRLLVHAVDRMRSDWAEGGEERRTELWRGVHEASDAVWNRPLAVFSEPRRPFDVKAGLQLLADDLHRGEAMGGAPDDLAAAREANRRLNYRAQGLESELAAYRRAVSQWEVSERGTYIPHSSLRTIGLASGKDILGSVRHLKHFERVEQAEAANGRLRADRAAVLAEVGEMLRKEIRDCGYPLNAGCDFCNGVTTVLEKVRRMADEAQQAGDRLLDERVAAAKAQPTSGAEDRCGECGHSRGAHETGDDPVTPGTCAACADDDAHHDFQAPN